MTVYVDDARIAYGRMKMCHMIADSLDELHGMALHLGVRREWFQAPPTASWPHYDISLSKRDRAIKSGAIPLGRRDFVRTLRRIKQGAASTPGGE